MPGRRNPRAKWVLPEVIDPPDHICITIPVPNDRQHVAAFWGALYNLTSGIFWADDTAHTARLVAKVWQKIYDDLAPQSCNPESPIPIDEWEDILSICESLRYQNGKLQGLCCGEWVDITGQGDSSLGGSGQPGGGAEQPTAGGPAVCYHGNQQAAFQWLAPTVVSAGDTLVFSNLDGAAWDGVAPFPLPGRWDCPTGKFFFAGECQNATETLVGGDPLPTAPHMSLVCQIAGVWYSCLSTITVPGGVSNAQVVVQLNDSAIADNQGQYIFDLCVTSHAAVTYDHIGNFALTHEGFTNVVVAGSTPTTIGSWTPGSGWDGSLQVDGVGVNTRGVEIHHVFAAPINVQDASFTYNLHKGTVNAGANNAIILKLAGANVVLAVAASDTDPDGTGKVLAIPHGNYTIDEIKIQVRDQFSAGAGTAGTSLVTGLDVAGTGVDPF